MASSGGPAAPPSLERVVGEAFVKAGQVILESRIYRPKSKAPQAQGRAWVRLAPLSFASPCQPPHRPSRRLLQFNLEVDEVEGASKALERWRRETGLPLVLEVRVQAPRGLHVIAAGPSTCPSAWTWHAPEPRPGCLPAGLLAAVGRRRWRAARQG